MNYRPRREQPSLGYNRGEFKHAVTLYLGICLRLDEHEVFDQANRYDSSTDRGMSDEFEECDRTRRQSRLLHSTVLWMKCR
jgi:hypothetical protein